MKRGILLLAATAGMLLVLPWTASRLQAEDSKLADAEQRRDREAVRTLLKEKADVNVPQADGATALSWAAHWDDADTVDLLVRAGANVNAANDLKVTPLMLAATNGNDAIVAKLLNAGGDPNVTRTSGETALFLAARTGAAPVVKLLLMHGANPNAKVKGGGTVLMFAALEGHAEVARLLIAAGADVEARGESLAPRSTASYQPRGSVQQLFKNQAIHPGTLTLEGDGEPPRAEGGYTPLLYAAISGDVDTVKAVLAGGAKVDEPAADGMTPLTLAVLRHRSAVALYLIDCGANVNAGAVGYMPLHLAAFTGEDAVAKALVEHKADVNARLQYPGRLLQSYYSYKPELMFGRTNHIGATPFLLASKAVDADLMKYLVGHGANPWLTTETQTNAMELAAGIGKREQSDFYAHVHTYKWDEDKAIAAITYLISLGFDVNDANQFGETALHGAAGHAALKLIQFLVDQGAYINARNWSDQTPLRVTEGHIYSDTFVRYPDASALLRKLGADPQAGTQTGFSVTGYVDDNLKDESRSNARKEKE
jgi:ankyrin repeat protein